MSVRLFAALTLPAAERQRLQGLCAGLPGVRWVAGANLHLTLRFIGEVEEGLLDDIDTALAGVRAPAFDFTLSGVGHFGNRRRLRALWAGVATNPALAHLHDKVDRALTQAGLAPEGRAFTPHVTLAYLNKSPPDRHMGEWFSGNALFQAGPVAAREITLFSSFRTAHGSVYAVEAVYPLTGA